MWCQRPHYHLTLGGVSLDRLAQVHGHYFGSGFEKTVGHWTPRWGRWVVFSGAGAEIARVEVVWGTSNTHLVGCRLDMGQNWWKSWWFSEVDVGWKAQKLVCGQGNTRSDRGFPISPQPLVHILIINSIVGGWFKAYASFYLVGTKTRRLQQRF